MLIGVCVYVRLNLYNQQNVHLKLKVSLYQSNSYGNVEETREKGILNYKHRQYEWVVFWMLKERYMERCALCSL